MGCKYGPWLFSGTGLFTLIPGSAAATAATSGWDDDQRIAAGERFAGLKLSGSDAACVLDRAQAVRPCRNRVRGVRQGLPAPRIRFLNPATRCTLVGANLCWPALRFDGMGARLAPPPISAGQHEAALHAESRAQAALCTVSKRRYPPAAASSAAPCRFPAG
jgi:hypothetical protein